MDATDIHPLRNTFFEPSRKCLKRVLKVITVFPSQLISNDVAMLDSNNPFTQRIYNILVMGRHNNSCAAKINFVQ
ncbi:hypothetical protein D1872_260630 [compost metagenome]